MKRMWWIGLLAGTCATATATITATVTFYRDVLPILQNHCQSCHRPGQMAPISFLTYKETRPWAESIKYVVVGKRMPPWFVENRAIPTASHPSLRVRDIETIVKWVDEGAVAGDPKDAPPPLYDQQGRWQADPVLPFSASRRGFQPPN